jgi:lipopolysaccharide transport system ATP-binding protein
MAYIEAKHLSVDFPIYDSSHRSLKKKIISAATGGRIAENSLNYSVVKALDDLSFSIKDGESVALMGHNGSGKSTLLRTLAGVYYPTGGSLDVKGSISTLIDLSQGMDMEATGWENITLRGLAMGMSLSEINACADEIAEFSELGDFLNIPVRTYSSGMLLRLAFSVSTSTPRDIVLMDEWLSVGDSNFADKSTVRLKQYLSKASILVIATHSEELAKEVCNSTIFLTHGKI